MISTKLYLKDVTLFGINAANPAGLLRAADICQEGISFAETVVITERLFPGATREEGRRNYSEFLIKKLTNYFTTSHVLVFDDDGYVQCPHAWDDKWLGLDWLGSPWEFYDHHQVGNGGFSLRSKKLCDILAADDAIDDYMPEDDRICRKYRPYLEEKYGIKFGTLDQARKFGIEAWAQPMDKRRYNGEFGYHGFNVTHLPNPPVGR